MQFFIQFHFSEHFVLPKIIVNHCGRIFFLHIQIFLFITFNFSHLLLLLLFYCFLYWSSSLPPINCWNLWRKPSIIRWICGGGLGGGGNTKNWSCFYHYKVIRMERCWLKCAHLNLNRPQRPFWQSPLGSSNGSGNGGFGSTQSELDSHAENTYFVC